MPTVKQYQKDPLAQNRELLNNPQVQAMLKTIRYAEGTAGDRGYNTRVGYGQFDDLSKKPGKKVYIPAIKDYSSAEGAYQFLNSTWDGVSKKLGLKDFSPESQDLAAIELIKNRGALTDVLNNNLTGALSKLSKEWASLPTAEGKSAYSNQKSKKVESLANVFYGQNSNYENSVAPYMYAPPKPFTTIQIPEMQTQQVSYLDTPQETTNLAEETEEKPSKINPQEEAFMQDLLTQMAQGVGYVEPEKSAVFQDGGRKQFKLQDERNLVQKDNTSTQRPNVEIDKKQLAFIAQYSKKNSIPIKEASERLYNENQYNQNNQVRSYTPQTTKSKVWEVATHPMTAAGYVARNEELPDNFSRGQINPHEMAVDIVNPFFYADQVGKFVKNTSEGNFTEAGMNALSVLPIAAEYQTIGRGLKAMGTEALINNIAKSKNARQVVGSLTGIPPESALPRLLPEELKIYRQVQDIGRMRATGKPISEQYKFAIEKGIPEEHLQKIFNKSKSEIENAVGTPQASQIQTAENIDLESFFARPQRQQQLTRDDLRARMRQWDTEIEDSGQISYDRDNVIRHTLEDNSNQLAPPPQELILNIPQNNRRGRVLLPNNRQPQSVFKNTTREIKELGQFTKEEIKNTIKDFSSEYPTYRGVVSENVPSLSLAGSGSLKNVSNKVTGEATSGISSGDVFTGSLNTSHSSYLPQLKQVFKYTDGKPNFLGYKPMNDMGFLSDYNYSVDDVAKYLNTEIDTQISRGIIPSNIQRPFVKKNSVLLPHYGIKQFQQGGTAEQKDQEWLQNWYANRVIPNKEVDAEYQKVKNDYEDVSHAIPYPTYTGYISPPSSLVNGRVEGVKTRNNEIALVSPPNKTTYLHEADHFIDQNLPNTPMQGIHSRIVEQNIAPKEIINNPYTKDNYEYLSQPTEVHARLQELRKEAGFKPTQEIKEKDFDNFQKNYKGSIQGINDLLQTFDKPHLIEILNTMADNSKSNTKNGVLYAQEGTTVGKQTPKEFLTEYLNSPNYRTRLKNSGYDVNKELSSRKQNLKDAKVYQEHQGFFESLAAFRFPPEKGSYYDNNTNSVNLDYPETVKGWNELYKGVLKMPSKKEVEAHELGHASVSANGYSVNQYDNSNLRSRSKNSKDVNSHDKMSSENKADLDAYRYTLKQEGLYDAGKEVFTKEHLKKQSKSAIKDRLLRNYSEKDLIWLMNNIAQNENNTASKNKQYAKDGGVIKDNNGYWNPQNFGKVVEISSPQISMKNVSQTLLGISKESGERKIMKPENEYFFNNTKTVTEIPLTKAEENFLKDLYS